MSLLWGCYLLVVNVPVTLVRLVHEFHRFKVEYAFAVPHASEAEIGDEVIRDNDGILACESLVYLPIILPVSVKLA